MKISKNQSLVLLFAFLTLGVGVGFMRAAVPQSTVLTTGGITTYVGHYVNFTQGLYQGATERVDAAGNAVFTTVDTGLGANELYGMDQNVLTTSDVNFSSVEADEFYLNSVNITDSIPVRETSYIITTDGVTVRAINGMTGATDYSGVDADTVINAALLAAPEYTTVNGKGLRYLINIPLLINKTGLILENFVIELDGANYTDFIGVAFIHVASNRSVVKNVLIEGKRTNADPDRNPPTGIHITGQYALVYNVNITGAWNHGIRFYDGANHGVARNCYTTLCGDDGYTVGGSDQVTFDSCIAENNANNGFEPDDDSTRTTIINCASFGGHLKGVSIQSHAGHKFANRVVIENCRFIGDSYGVYMSGNIVTYPNEAYSVKITGCIFEGLTEIAIYNIHINDLLIQGNEFRGNKYDIRLLSENSGYITNQLIYDNLFCSPTIGTSIELYGDLRNLEIKRNVFKDVTYYPINIKAYSNGNGLYHCDISDNVFNKGYRAIWIQGKGVGYCDDIKITDNHIYGCQSNSRGSITLHGVFNAIVRENFVYDSSGYAIEVNNYTTYVSDNIVIVDNTLYDILQTPIVAVGTNIVIARNHGEYITENFGTQEVYNTNTTATITHELAGTPTSITITPTWDAADAYVSAVNSTHITVTFADPTATKKIYWEAYYRP